MDTLTLIRRLRPVKKGVRGRRFNFGSADTQEVGLPLVADSLKRWLHILLGYLGISEGGRRDA